MTSPPPTVLAVDDVGLEVYAAVTMKSSTFWDMKKSRPVKVSRRFGGTYRLRLRVGE
jgi:hypothetical protein